MKSKSNQIGERRRAVSILVAVTLSLMLNLLASDPAWAQFGRIVGKVTEAGSGDGMPGANVFVQGTSLGSSTNIDGRYVISRVPVGTYTLEVSYLGYEKQTRAITVESSVSATADFALEESALITEEIVVLGVRAKNQARALNQQMNATNIRNVVASDQMGRFPDASAPEALQRIPGIHVVRDQGEGRYVQIRGGSPAMTSVSFNGERMPSPEGDVRQIAMDAVPTEILESIEVSKAITPDMDADAIGGAVNMVTKRAPEGGMLTVEGAPGYGSIRDDVSGKGSVTWGNRFNDGKVGVLASGTVGKRFFGSDDLESSYEFNDQGLADDELEELEVRHYTLSRERRGFTGILDYRLNENSTLYINGIWTEMRDIEIRRRLNHLVADEELEYQHKDRFEILRTWNFTAGGEHLFRNDMKFDYHATVTRSEEDTPRDMEIGFVQGDVAFAPDLSNPDEPNTNPTPGAIDGVYEFDEIEPAISNTRNTDYVAAMNLEIPYAFGRQSVGAFKIGGKFRHKDKEQDVTESAFELIDGADDIFLGQGIGAPFDISGYNAGNYQFPSLVPGEQEVLDFVRRFSNVLEEEIDAEADVEDFDAQERTFAFYGMTEMNFTPKLMLLGGVRFERTELENTGFAFDPETETVSPQEGSSSYNKIFPMIHARYKITPTTNIRAAVTTAMLRPNFFDLAPFRIEDDGDVELGNPELEPASSVNLDLLFEHYIRPLGVVTFGGFYRTIQDPIFRFTQSNDIGGDTVQPGNGDEAWVAGFETAYQQQLKFLPGVLNGLGIYANYTITSSETTLPEGRKADLAGQAKHVLNGALSYERGRFSGQFSANFHDKFVEEFGSDIGGGVGESFSDVFVDSHLQFDLSANFRITNKLSVFGEWVNLTNEPWVLFQTHEDRPIQREFYESWVWFGFNLTR